MYWERLRKLEYRLTAQKCSFWFSHSERAEFHPLAVPLFCSAWDPSLLDVAHIQGGSLILRYCPTCLASGNSLRDKPRNRLYFWTLFNPVMLTVTALSKPKTTETPENKYHQSVEKQELSGLLVGM